MSEVERHETKILKAAESIIEEIKKLNEVLKNSRITVLTEELEAYARALRAVIVKSTDDLHLEFHYNQDMNYKIYIITSGYYIDNLVVSKDTSVASLFNTIFTSRELREALVEKILMTITEISREIAAKANLFERIRRLEEALEREVDP